MKCQRLGMFPQIQKVLFNRSPATRRAYQTAINDWCEFLGCAKGTAKAARAIATATPEKALEYLEAFKSRRVRGEQIGDITLQHRFALLRALYTKLMRLEVVDKNPFEQIVDTISWRQRKQKRPTKLIPFEKVEELLDAPSANTKDGVRDRALLSMLFGAALRRSEARGVRLGDIRITPKGTLYLSLWSTKAGVNQDAPLPPWAAERLSVLVSQRKSEGATESDYLFVFYYTDGTVRGQLSIESIYRTFKYWCRFCGIDAAPHAARATAVTQLLSLGYSREDAKAMLRHKTDTMVAVYDKRQRGVDDSPVSALRYPSKKVAK